MNGYPCPSEMAISPGLREVSASIQINVLPAKARAADLYVVTCRWDPGEERTVGLDW